MRHGGAVNRQKAKWALDGGGQRKKNGGLLRLLAIPPKESTHPGGWVTRKRHRGKVEGGCNNFIQEGDGGLGTYAQIEAPWKAVLTQWDEFDLILKGERDRTISSEE